MTYSKKQMMPLIEKFGINPETNQLFIDICTMFDGQPNYQLWGVKVIFSKACNIERLQFIKEWAVANANLVKSLKQQNIIVYSSKQAIDALVGEMNKLSKIALVKHVIASFNTDQRKMLEEYLKLKNESSTSTTTRFDSWFPTIEKFSKLSFTRRNNFIKKNSAVKTLDTLLAHINEAIAAAYEWNREDLLAFVANNTPDSDVVFDDGKNIVVLRVKSYASSKKLCAGGRTGWCITTSDSQWNNYVTSKNNSQYFFFDFSKDEKDELAHIGFTVSDEHGITHAHSTKDASLMNTGISYRGGHVNIFDALKNANVKYGSFMPLKNLVHYKWCVTSLLEYLSSDKHAYSVAYHNGNKLIVSVSTKDGLTRLISHTFIPRSNINVDPTKTRIYIFFDFDVDVRDDNSINALYYVEDQYKTPGLSNIWNAFGRNTTKDGYLQSLGISADDYLSREEISPDILLHKYIDEGEEASALKLLEKAKGVLNINYEFNGRIPVFSAMQNKMFKLVTAIIEDDKFNFNTDDAYGEPLLSSLLYLYTCDEIANTKKDKTGFAEMISTLIDCKKIDLNAQDINLDTPLSISAEHKELDWVTDILVARPEVDVNIVDEFDMSALTNAIRTHNTHAIIALGKRPDLVVRARDITFAKENKIDLDSLIKPEPMDGLEGIVRRKTPAPERDFAKLFEMAMNACC